jgi:hypothetical protein
MVSGKEGERFDWDWLERQEVEFRDEHVVHVRLPAPLLIKVDGRTSHCAIRTGNGAGRREAGPAFKSPGCCTLESGEPGKPGPCAQ